MKTLRIDGYEKVCGVDSNGIQFSKIVLDVMPLQNTFDCKIVSLTGVEVASKNIKFEVVFDSRAEKPIAYLHGDWKEQTAEVWVNLPLQNMTDVLPLLVAGSVFSFNINDAYEEKLLLVNGSDPYIYPELKDLNKEILAKYADSRDISWTITGNRTSFN